MSNHGADAHEVRTPIAGLKEWSAFVQKNPWVHDAAFISQLVANVAAHGVSSHFHGGPHPVAITGQNYRETIVAHGLSSRTRAVLDEIVEIVGGDLSKRILMLEAITPFALAVRGRFPYALAVEYLPTPADQEKFFPVPHCDILKTDFKDASFDIVVSNDVLEHVPNLTQAMAETRRILRPGGACIATFPFAYGSAETIQRAVLRSDGQIQHLMEPPEYHGNPVDPQGSLVFQVPGWDILSRCKSLGYRRAEMLFISSTPRGVTGAECAGILILRAFA